MNLRRNLNAILFTAACTFHGIEAEPRKNSVGRLNRGIVYRVLKQAMKDSATRSWSGIRKNPGTGDPKQVALVLEEFLTRLHALHGGPNPPKTPATDSMS